MSKLTALEVRNQKAPCRLADGNGLFFEITSSRIKRWLYRYKICGKQGKFIIGRYPAVSLSDAREELNLARQLVKQGLNPAQKRKKDKAENIAKQELEKFKRDNSFKKVALEWYDLARRGEHKAKATPWSVKHTKDVLSSFERDVFPAIGDMSIEEIRSPAILKIIDQMTSRGVYDNTRKAVQRVNQVFNFAIIKGRCESNPTAPVLSLLPSSETTHNPALVEEDLGELLRDLAKANHLYLSTNLAIRFTIYTALRSQEVRCATWDEIDWEKKELHIQENRTKKRRAHIVPLSKQAIAVITKAGEAFGREGFIFPSPRGRDKPLSDNTLSKAIRNLGQKDKYRGKQTVHGLRASFRTMAAEHTDYKTDVLEVSINHKVGDKTQQAYNRSKYLKQRHKLFQWWANKLHALEHGIEIVSSKEVVHG